MASFARLLIEPLFAYNHFEDDENDEMDDGIEDIDDDSSSYEEEEMDENGNELEQKKIVIKGKNGFKIKLKM